MAWWTYRPTLVAVVTDILHAELSRLRPGSAPPPRPWPEQMPIGEAGLGCDSLEKLSLAAVLGRALRLDRSGLEDHLLVRTTLGAWVELASICLSRDDSSLVFSTSGSTGEPKPCEHPLALLEQETAFLAELFADRRRIVSAVPSHHIYGFLYSVLLPARLRVPVSRRLDRSTVALAGDLVPGDLVIGFPDFWRLAAHSVDEFPPDVDGVTSTAPFPGALGETLARLGLGRLSEIYGSSETAGLGWRPVGESAFELFPYWSRAEDVGGEVLARCLPDGSESRQVPQDHLFWSEDGRFVPQGRRDEAFQVGGVNVHPSRIAAALTRHPAVAAASVRPMRPEEGNRVKAFIVPREPWIDQAGLAEILARWADETLSPAERPKSFRFGSQLPRDSLGKASDWDIGL
jgi:4-coumarate--CoA ligase (photoactive yellow protein activation family)